MNRSGVLPMALVLLIPPAAHAADPVEQRLESAKALYCDGRASAALHVDESCPPFFGCNCRACTVPRETRGTPNLGSLARARGGLEKRGAR